VKVRSAGLNEIPGELGDVLLVERLAQQVLHWGVAPDRFLLGNRSWKVRWRFDPLNKIEDACVLLDAAAPTRYSISLNGGCFQVEVEIKDSIGRASGASRPRTIVLALARSLRLQV
jgi:hypothetical protein